MIRYSETSKIEESPWYKRLLCVLFSVILSVSLVPSVAFGEPNSASANSSESDSSQWQSQIDEMLAAGDYQEGSVIALVDNTIVVSTAPDSNSSEPNSPNGTNSENGISTFSAEPENDLLDSAESLMNVSPEAYVTATGDSLEAQDTANGISLMRSTDALESDDTLSFVKIQREGASTRDLLNELANDPRVLLAQPDYIIKANDSTPTKPNEETISAETDNSLPAETDNSPQAEPQETLSAESENKPSTESQKASSTEADKTTQLQSKTVSSITASTPTINTSPNVDLSGFQWGFENSGSMFRVPNRATGFDISPPGWAEYNSSNSSNTQNTSASTTSSANSYQNSAGVVAVIDSGIDVTHPDIQNVMHDMAPYHIEGGGKYGFNAIAGQDSTDISTSNFHGTFCAGIIAADWNGIGTSGAARGVELIGVRALNDNGVGNSSDLVRGFDYLCRAVDAGADIRAASYSVASSSYNSVVSIAMAQAGEKGIVSIVSTDNYGSDLDAEFSQVVEYRNNPYVITVGATNAVGDRARYSNYGQLLCDVMAPGSNILSTTTTSTSVYFPQADSNPAGFATFDSDDSQQLIFNQNQPDTPVGHLADDISFDAEGSSWAVSLAEMEQTGDDYSGYDYRICAKIPVNQDSAQTISSLSAAICTTGNDEIIYTGMFVKTIQSDGEVAWNFFDGPFAYTSVDDTWSILSVTIPEGTQLYVEDGCLQVLVTIYDAQYQKLSENTTCYIDSLGAGNTEVPYAFQNGVSMAVPAVSGAVAILSEEEEIAQIDDKATKARTLIGLTKATTKTYDSLKGTCQSNGMIDFDAQGENATPVPESASVSETENTGSANTTITIEGSYFGERQGSVSIAGMEAPVVSWSNNTIQVSCPEELESGLLNIDVTSAQGNTGTFAAPIELPSAPLDVAIFDNIDLPEGFEEPAGSYSNGLSLAMQGFDGGIYIAEQGVTKPIDSIWRYDIASDTWEQLPAFPARDAESSTSDEFFKVSFAPYEGRLLMLGARSDHSTTLLEYSPDDKSWTDLGVYTIPFGATLANVDGQLMLFGRTVPSDENPSIVVSARDDVALFDLETQTITPVGNMVDARAFPTVVAINGEVYISNGTYYFESGGSGYYPTSLGLLTPDYSDSSDSEGLPTWSAQDMTGYMPEQTRNVSAYLPIAATAEGLCIVGFREDTYQQESGSASQPSQSETHPVGSNVLIVDPEAQGSTSIPARTAYGMYFGCGAFGYDNKVYALGIAPFDGGFVFRSYDMETLPVAGDVTNTDVDPDNPGSGESPDDPSNPGGNADGSNSESESGIASEEGQSNSSALPQTSDCWRAPLALTAGIALLSALLVILSRIKLKKMTSRKN